MKQVNVVKSFFKRASSILHKRMSDGSRNYVWILDKLPQQRTMTSIHSTIPSHIQDLLDKEETIPKVLQKGRSGNNQPRTQKKVKHKQNKGNLEGSKG